jgi:hypothetical protein
VGGDRINRCRSCACESSGDVAAALSEEVTTLGVPEEEGSRTDFHFAALIVWTHRGAWWRRRESLMESALAEATGHCVSGPGPGCPESSRDV